MFWLNTTGYYKELRKQGTFDIETQVLPRNIYINDKIIQTTQAKTVPGKWKIDTCKASDSRNKVPKEQYSMVGINS